MSQTIVQRKHAYPSTSAAFASNVTAGNAILVFCSGDANGSIATISDNQGNSYTPIRGFSSAALASGRAFIATNAAGGATTITIGGSVHDCGITAFEISGVDNTTPVAGSNDTSATGTTVQASVTLAASGGLYCFWADENNNLWSSFTAGLSTGGHDSGHYDADGYLVSTAAGTYNVGITTISSNTSGVVCVVALNDAAGGGGGFDPTAAVAACHQPLPIPDPDDEPTAYA